MSNLPGFEDSGTRVFRTPVNTLHGMVNRSHNLFPILTVWKALQGVAKPLPQHIIAFPIVFASAQYLDPLGLEAQSLKGQCRLKG